MRSLVVLFAVFAAACGSLIPAQPPYHPAVVLDPHGRPLDTAEVINARALHLQAKHLEGHYAPLVHAAPVAVAHAAPLAVVAAPAAVSHQSRIDVHSSPAVVAHAAIASPVLAHSALAHGYSHGYGHGFGHWLRKRSLAYAAPVVAHVAHVAPAAVSHQSRVDVISSPAVVSHHAVAAPVLAHAVAAPVVAHVAPAAVSHQSRVDVRTSHPVVSHAVVAAPALSAHSAWAAPAYYGHGYGYGHSYGHGYGHAGLLHSSPYAAAW